MVTMVTVFAIREYGMTR